MEWLKYRNCEGVDNSVFFPNLRKPDPYAEARSYCSECSVTDECLQFARDNDCRAGMFGGLTPTERGTNLSHSTRVDYAVEHGAYKDDDDEVYVPDKFDLWENSPAGIRQVAELRRHRREVMDRVDRELAELGL